MSASRSRTERWRECLQQVFERDGALEISIADSAPGTGQSSLIWRVRILALNDREIVVEQPSALGQIIELGPDVEIVAGLAIGQNRWMFRTRTLGHAVRPGLHGRQIKALRLASPEVVERCQRRNFYRISTTELSLPPVECWPIVEPSSVIAAELANQAQILSYGQPGMAARLATDDPMVLPEVGPRFAARLVNIGGGGAGLVVDRQDAAAVDRTRLFWLRVNLTPQIPIPLGMTGRLAHTHLDSAQNVYAGIAFEFAFNPGHKQFVVHQICRYVAELQKLQSSRGAA